MNVDSNFDLVLNGETQQVVLHKVSDGVYKVLLQGKCVGDLHSAGRKSKFICTNIATGEKFGGATRHLAITNMVYTCLKK